MDLGLSDEQMMLRDTVAAYLVDKYDFEQRQAAIKGAHGWRPDIWRAFADELAILGASFPESLGGFGGGAIENMIVMEEFGKVLALEPYLPTVVIGGGFLKHSGHPGAIDLAEGVIAGRTIFAFASAEPRARYNLAALATRARRDGAGWVLDGQKSLVIAGPLATHYFVTARTSGGERDRDGVSLFLVEASAPGITRTDFTTVDGLRASELRFDTVRLGQDALFGPLDCGLPLIERVVDAAIAASCGEACGVLRKLLEGTVDYTQQRQQFGRPLSSFQALQHRMVDMFIQVEQAISMTYLANIRVEQEHERERAVSAAKVQVGAALKFVGEGAVQLHGGMGITEELAIGHYFKRATGMQSLFGSIEHHLARYERLADASHLKGD